MFHILISPVFFLCLGFFRIKIMLNVMSFNFFRISNVFHCSIMFRNYLLLRLFLFFMFDFNFIKFYLPLIGIFNFFWAQAHGPIALIDRLRPAHLEPKIQGPSYLRAHED